MAWGPGPPRSCPSGGTAADAERVYPLQFPSTFGAIERGAGLPELPWHTIDVDGVAVVVQDDFENTYQLEA